MTGPALVHGFAAGLALVLVVTVPSGAIPGASLGKQHRPASHAQDFINPSGERDEVATGQLASGQYALFLFYTWNREMFQQTFNSLTRAGFKRIIVLDNSAEHHAFKEGLAGTETVRTRTTLTFAQLHNVARSIALERGFEFYFWAHGDVAVMPHSADRSFVQEAVNCVVYTGKMNPSWGVAYFTYDWLAAFRTAAVAHTPWDEFLPHSKADCDYYHSLRLAGWTTHECGHVGKVYHLASVLDIPDEFDAAMKVLDDDQAHPRDAKQRTPWRDAAMEQHDKVGRIKAELASFDYYELKWNTVECDIRGNSTPWATSPDTSWRRADRMLLDQQAGLGTARPSTARRRLHRLARALRVTPAGATDGAAASHTKSATRQAGLAARHHTTRDTARMHQKQQRAKTSQSAAPASHSGAEDPAGREARTSLLRAGFAPDQIIVLDNSRRHDLTGVGLPGTEVIPTHTSLTFPQLHDAARSIAAERGYEVYFWMPADVMVLDREEGVKFSAEALRCVKSHTLQDRKWAVAFFEHDWFVAFRTAAMGSIPWDNYIPHGKAACARGDSDPSALPKWQDEFMTVRESVGQVLAAKGGEEYYRVKWGTDQCELPAEAAPWPSQQVQGT
ncbi:hypothetical protein WJX72_003821 [[Myrmecia] bisecta]|uniref:Uncharacterized protein n=1 Tax=[Myrmecia] bisecta TaxID=41462 RepID=A0AAW1QET3_9CHLO